MDRMIKQSSTRTMGSLLLLSLFMLTSIPVNALSEPQREVHIYCFAGFSSSETLSSYFSNRSDLRVVYYDLNNSTYSDEFLKIVNILAGEGVQVVPPDLCTPCLLYHYTWNEIYLMYDAPLAGFFEGGRLAAVTIAITDCESLGQALMVESDGEVEVFTGRKTLTLTHEGIRTELEGHFPLRREESEVANAHVDAFRLLPYIIGTAAVDAVNPCEFYVLTVLLSLVFFHYGRKTVLKAGIAYSLAVFMIYFLMGLGLLRLISYVQEARLLIVILGFSVGLRAVLNFVFGVFGLSLGLRDAIGTFLNKRFKRVPRFLSERLSARLRSASEKPITAFLIGVVASAFLLPCTSGPYLIALSLMANLETLLEGLSLLAVYNSIIIAPFLAITLGVYMLRVKTSELKKWSSEKQKWLNLAAGLTMILLSLYLVFATIA